MKVKKTYKKIDQDKYGSLKLLQESKISAANASKIFGIHPSTIYRVYGSSNFDNYKEITRNLNAKFRTKKSEPEVTVNQTDKLLGNVTDLFEEIRDNQQAILIKVTWIEENAEIRTKRKFF